MTRLLTAVFFFYFALPLLSAQGAGKKVFSEEEFLQRIRGFHPVMQQARLLENQADAALLESRGEFDPKLYGEYDDKSFDDKNYWRRGEGGLKIPLWFGADIKAAYTWNDGVFLNNEANLPAAGQAVLGIEMPVLQGLRIDKRRTQVKQAELLGQANEAERRSIVNDLMLDAASAYWNWAYAYRTLQIYENSLDLANARFVLIRESFLQGDKPAIDTLESMIQVQNREVQRNQARLDFQNAGLELSNYLWAPDFVPLEVSDDLIPESFSTLNELLYPENPAALLENLRKHPELEKIRIKDSSLALKEDLKRESFKPELNLNFNLLGQGTNFLPGKSEDENIGMVFTENYKWGAEFSFPLFLRKARGGVELIQLERTENALKLDRKRLELENKLRMALQQQDNTRRQITIQDQAVNNYDTLLDAENVKFQIGESSVFLLNSREQKLIEAQLKLNKSKAEYEKNRFKILWAAGLSE